MVDAHNHILFNVDDGCRTIEESIILLKKMEKLGFNKIILTPHYIKETTYIIGNTEKESKLNQLKEKLKEEKINIELYLGNEIFITNNIVDLLKNNNISSINKSRYILIELPFKDEIIGLTDILYELKYHKLIPIIAHPERYTYFQNNVSKIDELREEGILFQANYSSILGLYGRKAKKTIKYLLKNSYVDFLGTDIHRITNTDVLDNFKKIEKKIIKIIGDEEFEKIIKNSENIINNKDIQISKF